MPFPNLVRHHQQTTVYYHEVVEAKVLGPADLILSLASAFIEAGLSQG